MRPIDAEGVDQTPPKYIPDPLTPKQLAFTLLVMIPGLTCSTVVWAIRKLTLGRLVRR